MSKEWFISNGKSLKRLIPFIAFLVLIAEIPVNYLPFIIIGDNNLKVIETINEILGFIILGGLGLTTVEKFSKKPNKEITPEIVEESNQV